MRQLLAACLLLSAVPTYAADSAPQACDHPCQHDRSAQTDAAPVQLDTRGAPTLGPSSAKVEVVVFSDFECPYCKRGAETVKQLEEKYGRQIRIVFMNEPLPMHEHARMAAAVAVAANAHGKFWQLHDWLFAHQRELSRESLLAEAEKLGLDRQKLSQALDTGVYEAQIQSDQDQAKRAGVMGTPTFFINGERVEGAQGLDVLSAIIDRDLAN